MAAPILSAALRPGKRRASLNRVPLKRCAAAQPCCAGSGSDPRVNIPLSYHGLCPSPVERANPSADESGRWAGGETGNAGR